MNSLLRSLCRLALFALIGMMSAQTWAVSGHEGESAATALQVKVLAQQTQSWNGATLPEYPQGQPKVSLLQIDIAPGAKVPWHKHPVINVGVLLSGELTVHTEQGKTLHLKPGDPIVEVVNTWHYGINEGSEIARIIVFYAGTTDLPLSIKREK